MKHLTTVYYGYIERTRIAVINQQ